MCSKTVGEGNPKSSAANINHPGKAIDTGLVTSPLHPLHPNNNMLLLLPS
jgi:hypothetical protein